MEKEIWEKAKNLAENLKAADAVINMEGILFEFGMDCKKEGLKRAVEVLDKEISELASDPWAYGNNTETTGYQIDILKSLKKKLLADIPKEETEICGRCGFSGEISGGKCWSSKCKGKSPAKKNLEEEMK